MSAFQLFLVSTLLLFSVAAPENLMAQETSTESVAEFSLVEYANETKISISFAGGKVEDFVKQLKAEAPELNVLVRSDAKNVELPQLSLKNISAGSAISSLTHLSLDALMVDLSQEEDYFIVGPNFNPLEETNKVTVLNVSMIVLPAGKPSPENQKTLLGAIENGLEMLSDSATNIKLSLHAETGLLFVRGKTEETALISMIVNELLNQ
jgi:hypothetical protein